MSFKKDVPTVATRFLFIVQNSEISFLQRVLNGRQVRDFGSRSNDDFQLESRNSLSVGSKGKGLD